MPYQKRISYQLLIFVTLCQHAKNYTVLSICSGEMVDYKILKPDWLRSFRSISQKQDFHKYSIRAATQQIL